MILKNIRIADKRIINILINNAWLKDQVDFNKEKYNAVRNTETRKHEWQNNY